jgi:hypothetical protein
LVTMTLLPGQSSRESALAAPAATACSIDLH